MATNSRTMRGVSPKQVFAVLVDGRTYADWVVGTRAIRAVEPGWPAPGSALHWTAGYGPLRKDDETRSLSCLPDSELVMEARAWPMGTARIALTVREEAGSAVVTLDEEPSRGLAKTLHNPLLDLAIKVRNVETLRRLESQARSRSTGR